MKQLEILDFINIGFEIYFISIRGNFIRLYSLYPKIIEL